MSLCGEKGEELKANEIHQDFLETLRKALALFPVGKIERKRLQEGIELTEYFALDPAPALAEDCDMLSVMGSVLFTEAQMALESDEESSVKPALIVLSNQSVQLRQLTYALGFYRGRHSNKKSV